MARLIGANNNEDIALLTNRKYYNKSLKHWNNSLGFSPDDLSNLHVWYKVHELSLSHNDLVSSLTDSSGNSLHATQGGADSLKPQFKSTSNTLNGYESIYFNGSSNILTADISGNVLNNRQATAFVIYQAAGTAGTTGGYLITSRVNTSNTYGNRTWMLQARHPGVGTFNHISSPGMGFAVGNGSFANTKNAYIPSELGSSYSWSSSPSDASALPFPEVMILGACCVDGSVIYDEYYVSVNGLAGNIGSAYVVNYNRDFEELSVGKAHGLSWGNFRGYVHEVIIYSDNKIGADHDKVVGYLAHKYGVASVLYKGHEYKLGPPNA